MLCVVREDLVGGTRHIKGARSYLVSSQQLGYSTAAALDVVGQSPIPKRERDMYRVNEYAYA